MNSGWGPIELDMNIPVVFFSALRKEEGQESMLGWHSVSLLFNLIFSIIHLVHFQGSFFSGNHLYL